jgi:hypothetical protein
MLLITNDFEDILFSQDYARVVELCEQIVATRPDVYAMDVAGDDICNYPTAVATPAAGNPADALLAQGIDPYGLFVKILKEAGIAVAPNYRMNDHHGLPAYWTPWERGHKDWSLGKDTGAWKTYQRVGDRAWREIGDLRQMDYAIEGVRQRRLAILREVLERYPVDGLQLDFGRSAPFLSEPKREKARYMTQFVRDVRALLDAAGKARGQRMTLGAILPWDVGFCADEGLEVKRWIDEGLLAYVAPGEWFYVDYNVPYAQWAALTKGTGCNLCPLILGEDKAFFATCVHPTTAVDEGKRLWLSDDFQSLDPPKIRALAENAYLQGADGIMFYNMYVRCYGKDYYPLLREWIDPLKIPAMTRHFFYARRLKYVPTEHYSFGLPDGYAPGEIEAFTPFTLDQAGDDLTYAFLFGSVLGTARAAFQFKLRDLGDADAVDVCLNGQRIVPDAVLCRACQPPAAPAFRYALWQAGVGSPPLRRGENVLNVTLKKRDVGRVGPVQVGEFELFVNPQEARHAARYG